MSRPWPAALLILLILIVALPVNALLAAKRFHAAPPSGRIKVRRYVRTILILWGVTGLALFALRLHGLDAASVGLRPPDHPVQLAYGLLALSAPLVAAWSGLRPTPRSDYAGALRALLPDERVQWAWFLAVAVSAGLCEEFLYRGYAITMLTAAGGSLPLGIAASTLGFGFAHAYQGRTGVIGATISGGVYAAVFVVTHSLYPCMLGHIVQDITGAVVLTRALHAPIDATGGPGGSPRL